jgi:hypothetical protein
MIKKLQKILSLNVFVLIVSLTVPLLLSRVSAAPPGNFQVAFSSDFPTEVAADLELLLEKTTRKAWDMVPGQKTQQGFNLMIIAAGSYKTGESCIISSNGKDLVQFQAPTINGLIFGVYRYLRDLGFKFYLPDDIYTIIPSSINIFSKTSKTVTPNLRIRDFFGTGGFGSGRSDADRSVQKAWQLWKWRNGFGTEFPLGGHVGETFNLNNTALLEKNPSWTATPIKQNGQVNVNTKLNYYNPAALDYFTDWVIKKYTDKNYKVPPVYIRDMVSIEPADGGDYMPGSATINGTKLSTPSDQVFYAANIAAQKLDKLFPGHPNIGVNLYAYSQHADVPSFPLHPRVFVQIIPYQFQSVAFGPAFIKRWSEKAKRFGLYDYYKYPDSHWDLPAGYALDELMTRALHAARSGSEGTTYETSYSKFATAIPLWVLSRYMADGNTKWEIPYNQLVKDLYGKASPAVQKLFALFYRQNQFSHSQLKSAFNFLQEAVSLNSDPLVQQRLEELKLYLVYIRLYQESQNLQTGNLEQRMLPFFKMAWTLYEKKIVHSYRIMQLISYGFLNTPGPDAATTQRYQKLHALTFPESEDPEAYWKQPVTTAAYSAKELSALYEKMGQATKNQPEQQTKRLSTASVITTVKKQFNPVKEITVQGDNYVRGYFTFYAEKTTTISINWSLTGDNSAPAITISGTNSDYSSVYDKAIKTKEGAYTVTVPAGETTLFVNAADKTTYRLKLTLNGAWLFFEPSPRGKMAFLNSNNQNTYKDPWYPTFFYVPPGTTEVKYKVQLNGLTIYNPAGKPTATTFLETQPGGFEIRSFKVDPNYQGKIWKGVVEGNLNYELLTIPDQWYMLQPK